MYCIQQFFILFSNHIVPVVNTCQRTTPPHQYCATRLSDKGSWDKGLGQGLLGQGALGQNFGTVTGEHFSENRSDTGNIPIRMHFSLFLFLISWDFKKSWVAFLFHLVYWSLARINHMRDLLGSLPGYHLNRLIPLGKISSIQTEGDIRKYIEKFI